MPASALDKRTLVQHAWRSWLAWQASLDHGLHRRGAAEVGRPSLLAAVTGAPFPLRLGLHDVHPVDPRSCANSSMLAGTRIQPSDFLTARLRGSASTRKAFCPGARRWPRLVRRGARSTTPAAGRRTTRPRPTWTVAHGCRRNAMTRMARWRSTSMPSGSASIKQSSSVPPADSRRAGAGLAPRAVTAIVTRRGKRPR